MAERQGAMCSWLCVLGAAACNALGGIEKGVPIEERPSEYPSNIAPVVYDPYQPPPPITPESCDDNPLLVGCDAPTSTSRGEQPETPLPEGLVRGLPLLIYDGSVTAPDVSAAMTTFKSPMGSLIAPDCNGNQTCFQGDSEICVSGSTSPVPTLDAFPSYWGAMLQMSFGSPWDRATEQGTAAGISFRIRGREIPELRLQSEGADTMADPLEFYCWIMRATDGERVNVFFDELETECWGGAGTKLPAAKPIMALDWQINSELSFKKDFDFCLSDVRLILPAP